MISCKTKQRNKQKEKVRERSSSSSSSTLQQKYSRRIYWPEVDQSNRTARQKMRRWRERQKKLSSKIITERFKKKSQQLKSRNPTDQHEWLWRATNQKVRKNPWNLKFKERKRKSENKLRAIAIKQLIKHVKNQRELS